MSLNQSLGNRMFVAFICSASCFVLEPSSVFAGDWKSLFNGQDMKMWVADKEGGWEVKEGLLASTPKGGYLWSRHSYTDCEIELEFRVSEKCNSGLFFRTDPKNPVQGGFEIQILDSHGKEEIGTHDCGALYDALKPSQNAVKPAGEWNRLRLKVQGAMVEVTLNEQKVVTANLDEWDTPKRNPDGTPNKFKTALKDLPRMGCIGLQYHGQPVWFRNIRVREI